VNEPTSPEPPAPLTSPPTPVAPEPPLPMVFLVVWSGFGLLTYLVVGGFAQFVHLAWGLWFAEIAIFVGATVIGWQLLRWKPLQAMGVSKFAPRAFFTGMAFGLVNYVAWAIPTMAAAQAIFPKSMVELFDASRIFDRQTPIELALVVVGVSVAAPWGEEFFFRGFMQRGLAEHRGAPRAIVVTAFIFSAFHLDPVGLVARFELGVLFGLLAWQSGSLWPAIGAHAANNLVSSVLFLVARSQGSAADEGALPWYVPLTMFLVGNVALIALVRALGPGLKVEQPNAFVPAPEQVSIAQRFAPWVLGGVVAVVVLLGVDRRGVALNVVDGLSQLPPAKLKRDEVKDLRDKVRSGDAPLEDYTKLLETLK